MLTFFFWLFIIYVAGMLFFRYLLPLLLKVYLRRLQKRFDGMGEQQQPTNRKQKAGEVNIDYVPEKRKNAEFIGEYIDFEEIKEKKD